MVEHGRISRYIAENEGKFGWRILKITLHPLTNVSHLCYLLVYHLNKINCLWYTFRAIQPKLFLSRGWRWSQQELSIAEQGTVIPEQLDGSDKTIDPCTSLDE